MNAHSCSPRCWPGGRSRSPPLSGSCRCSFMPGFLALQARVHAGSEAPRPRSTWWVIGGALRPPRGCRGGGGRRSDLAVAARVHGAARPVPRRSTKRRGELVLVGAEGAWRPVLARLLARAGRPVARRCRSPHRWWPSTPPYAVDRAFKAGDGANGAARRPTGLGRYLVLVHRDDLGEEPEQLLLADRRDPRRPSPRGRLAVGSRPCL